MEMKELKPNEISESKLNARKTFDEKKMADLKESIKQKGVLEPIIVRKVGEKYQVVCGERRVRACKELGLKTIPAIVRDLTDDQALEFQVIENLQTPGQRLQIQSYET